MQVSVTGNLSGEAYGKQLGRRILALAAVVFGIPIALFIAGAIYAADFSFPTRVEMAESIRATTGTGLGVFAYLLFVGSMVRPSWRRMRALRLPSYLSLIVIVFFMMDLPFFVSREETRIFGYSIFSRQDLPLSLMSALSITIAMAFAGSPQNGECAFRRFGYAGLVAAAAIAFILVGSFLFIAAAKGIDFLKYQVEREQEISQVLLWFVPKMYWFLVLSPFAFLALAISLVRCVLLSRREPSAPAIR